MLHATRALAEASAAVTLIAVPWMVAGAWADDGSWSHYGGSVLGLQYSPLEQIDTGNVARLQRAWTYRTGERSDGAARAYAFQANPILAEGRLYLATASAVVIALEPTTGREIWRHDVDLDRSRRPAEIASRGVTSWIDRDAPMGAACRHRIFVGTLDARMIALDGATGEPCRSFGDGGSVPLDRGVRGRENGEAFQYTVTSPPVVVDDVLVTGSAIGDNRAVELELGIVRGLDARTGEELWRWDPIPRTPGRPAFTDWSPEEARRTGAANAWAPLAADPELGWVFVPTGSASPDFYGGERRGDNPHANSVVALRAATGEQLWARQLVHHDLWDYDVSSQPTLATLRRGAESIPALIQGTKMGHAGPP